MKELSEHLLLKFLILQWQQRNVYQTLIKDSLSYKTSVTHSGSHAGYYPNAFTLSIKLTFHPETGRIYGLNVGVEGVDKRIDQIALLIKREAVFTI